MADKHGPAFNLRFGIRRIFVVSSWEVAKECFTINDKSLASRPLTLAAKHMAYDYAVFEFAPHSCYWREMRKIVTLELLSNRRVEMLKHVRFSEVELGIQDLYKMWSKESSGGPVLVELCGWLLEMTLNIVVRMVAGKRYCRSSATGDNGEGPRCRKAVNQFFHLMGTFVASNAIPFLWWLDLHGGDETNRERSCPGVSFAMQVLHLTLAHLLQSFELATPSDQPAGKTEGQGLTIPKATPLEVLITPRLREDLYGC